MHGEGLRHGVNYKFISKNSILFIKIFDVIKMPRALLNACFKMNRTCLKTHCLVSCSVDAVMERGKLF